MEWRKKSQRKESLSPSKGSGGLWGLIKGGRPPGIQAFHVSYPHRTEGGLIHTSCLLVGYRAKCFWKSSEMLSEDLSGECDYRVYICFHFDFLLVLGIKPQT
jgi:hypothetical protein